MILVNLFLVFARIGLFAIGGAYSFFCSFYARKDSSCPDHYFSRSSWVLLRPLNKRGIK